MDAWTSLAPRARLLFHAQALIRLVLFWVPVTAMAGAAAAATWSAWSAFWGASAWMLFVFLLSIWWPTWSFERWGYRLREGDLLIANGVLFRSVVAIPTGRIQHVDTRQGPLEQWLGLARLHVYTASGMGADGVIPGLVAADAEGLRDQLVAARGDDGV